MVAVVNRLKKGKEFTVNELLSKVRNLQTTAYNLMTSRTEMMGAQRLDPEGRNLAKECGYPEGDPSLSMYKMLFDRVGIARRIVEVYPEESWSIYPYVYEIEEERKTKFERAWEQFEFEHNPWHYLHRLDVLSGIGRYGALLIGFNDGALDLRRPVVGVDDFGQKTGKRPEKPLKVTFLRPFSEDLVRVVSYDTNLASPRYGEPRMYAFTVSSTPENPNLLEEGEEDNGRELKVHWTRVLHCADNRRSSNIFGDPRLHAVVDDVLDIRKVKGSAAEMFWKGGFPGISFETFPELAATAELDADSMKAEIEAYSAGLQRYIRLIGMTAKSLAPQVSDPSNHLNSLIQLICAAIKVPMRIFMGTEAGHLASQQDSITWNRRLKGRQERYVLPMIIKPFIERLMLVGVLPQVDKFIVKWPDLNAMSDTDKAKVSLQKSQAVLQYVTSGSYVMIPPKMFLTGVLNYSDEEARAIIKAAGGEEKMTKAMKDQMKSNQSMKAKSGTSPEKSTGAGGRRNGLGRGKK